MAGATSKGLWSATDPALARSSIVLGPQRPSTSETASDSTTKSEEETSEEIQRRMDETSKQPRVSGGSDYYEEPEGESN